MSMDFFPVSAGLLSRDNRAMLSGQEIIARVEALAAEKEIRVPPKPKDAFRKIEMRGTLPSLPTLIECAQALGTSVAYLIGETDDPSAIVRLPTQDDAPPLTVERASAAASFAVSDVPLLALSFDTHQAGVQELLLTEAEGRLLADDMETGIAELADHRRRQSSSSQSSA